MFIYAGGKNISNLLKWFIVEDIFIADNLPCEVIDFYDTDYYQAKR